MREFFSLLARGIVHSNLLISDKIASEISEVKTQLNSVKDQLTKGFAVLSPTERSKKNTFLLRSVGDRKKKAVKHKPTRLQSALDLTMAGLIFARWKKAKELRTITVIIFKELPGVA